MDVAIKAKLVPTMLRFKGVDSFRPRLVLSALSGKTVRISDIRSDTETPGLKDHEASLLRLISKISVGSKVEINPTGTTVVFKPGVLAGGDDLVHECPPSRALGYFIEALLCLAPFGKAPLRIVLRGVTNSNDDPSVDALRTVTLPMMQFFGITENLSLKVRRRGAPPLGGGEVVLQCGVVRELKPVQFERMGKIKRIRGIAYATKVAPQMGNRMIDAAREVLGQFTHDLYIHTDHYRGAEGGLCVDVLHTCWLLAHTLVRSPGFGLTLVAESSSGVLYCGEWMAGSSSSSNEGGGRGSSSGDSADAEREPEVVGARAAKLLLAEVLAGGCVDTTSQSIALLFCALGPEDVSRLRIGAVSPYTESFLTHLNAFFGINFRRVEDSETKTVIASCVGTGFLNLARKVQ